MVDSLKRYTGAMDDERAAAITEHRTLRAQVEAIRDAVDDITLWAVPDPDDELEYVDAHLMIARAHLTLALGGLIAEEHCRDEPPPARQTKT